IPVFLGGCSLVNRPHLFLHFIGIPDKLPRDFPVFSLNLCAAFDQCKYRRDFELRLELMPHDRLATFTYRKVLIPAYLPLRFMAHRDRGFVAPLIWEIGFFAYVPDIGLEVNLAHVSL